jgi:hypothetical protein
VTACRSSIIPPREASGRAELGNEIGKMGEVGPETNIMVFLLRIRFYRPSRMFTSPHAVRNLYVSSTDARESRSRKSRCSWHSLCSWVEARRNADALTLNRHEREGSLLLQSCECSVAE